ncbi:MAG: glutathione S-transferase family protein [Marivibrio sp.]|uniref:glutathione S-transferase family protein n=1 Tax=Marivibrio sp. TaxID=2039719 RepID=UPI0032EBA74E
MLTLYDCLESGNGHKVRLLLSLLGRECRLVLKDIHAGETRTPEFLTLNPDGRIPLLRLEDGTCLAESNAILVWLAEGSSFLPDDRLERARALAWMFWEQYNHEPNVAVARFWAHHPAKCPSQEQLAQKREKGRAALELLDRHLSTRDWLVGGRASVADLCLYSYSSVSEEGGVDRDGLDALNRWLGRIEALPGFIAMEPWSD